MWVKPKTSGVCLTAEQCVGVRLVVVQTFVVIGWWWLVSGYDWNGSVSGAVHGRWPASRARTWSVNYSTRWTSNTGCWRAATMNGTAIILCLKETSVEANLVQVPASPVPAHRIIIFWQGRQIVSATFRYQYTICLVWCGVLLFCKYGVLCATCEHFHQSTWRFLIFPCQCRMLLCYVPHARRGNTRTHSTPCCAVLFCKTSHVRSVPVWRHIRHV